jgi:outer membrane lipoprotein-sorting protein
MRKFFLTLFFIFITSQAQTSIKDKIIKNLKNTENLAFSFEQNINGKVENGKCILQYPKKILCKYNLKNKKILVSNGRSLVIKTLSSYYIYPIEKTPLNLILDKNFFLKKIESLKERTVNGEFINYTFLEDENEINLFFDKETYNLVGWQTLDIYQNLSITYLSAITKNVKLKKNLFKLPSQN